MKFFSLLILLQLFSITTCAQTEIEEANGNEPTADTDSGVDVHAGNEEGSTSGKDNAAVDDDSDSEDDDEPSTTKLNKMVPPMPAFSDDENVNEKKIFMGLFYPLILAQTFGENTENKKIRMKVVAENVNQEHSEKLSKYLEKLSEENLPRFEFKLELTCFGKIQGGMGGVSYELHVNLERAKNLPPVNSDGEMNAYIMTNLFFGEKSLAYKDKAQMSEVYDETLNPDFSLDQKISFKFILPSDYAEDDKHKLRLSFEFWHKNGFFKRVGKTITLNNMDEKIGTVEVELNNLLYSHGERNTQIAPRTYTEDIVIEKKAEKLAYHWRLKLGLQQKIFDSLLRLTDEQRYKAMLKYCNNEWKMLSFEQKFSINPAESTIQNIFNAKIDSSAPLDWKRFEECVGNLVGAQIGPNIGMTEGYMNLVLLLMKPRAVQLAVMLNNAFTSSDIALIMEIVSTQTETELEQIRQADQAVNHMKFKHFIESKKFASEKIKNFIGSKLLDGEDAEKAKQLLDKQQKKEFEELYRFVKNNVGLAFHEQKESNCDGNGPHLKLHYNIVENKEKRNFILSNLMLESTQKYDAYANIYLLPDGIKVGQTEIEIGGQKKVPEKKLYQFKMNGKFYISIPEDRDEKIMYLLISLREKKVLRKVDKHLGEIILQILTFTNSEIRDENTPQCVRTKTKDLILAGLKKIKEENSVKIGDNKLDFDTYFEMSKSEVAQRTYYNQLLKLTLRKLKGHIFLISMSRKLPSSTSKRLVYGAVEKIQRDSHKKAAARTDLERILLSRFQKDLGSICHGNEQEFARIVDKLYPKRTEIQWSGSHNKSAPEHGKQNKFDRKRVPEARPYRRALRILLNIENKDMAGYTEFLNNFPQIVQKHTELLLHEVIQFELSTKPFGVKFGLVNDNILLEGLSKNYVSRSAYLHNFMKDLNYELLKRLELAFYRQMYKMEKKRFGIKKRYDIRNMYHLELRRVDKIDPEANKNAPNPILELDPIKLREHYETVFQHLLRFHNMAFAIVLHCTGHPYEDEWNQNGGNSGQNGQETKETPKIEKEKGYESDEIVEEDQSQQEAFTDLQERLEQATMSAQFASSHLDSPEDESEESRLFGDNAHPELGDFKCPLFRIDVPKEEWETYRRNSHETVKQLAQKMADEWKLLYDYEFQFARWEGVPGLGNLYKYKYNLGRVILRKLGYFEEKVEENVKNVKNAQENVVEEKPNGLQIAQKIIDQIGESMESKHIELMSESDEFFVFGQMGFSFEKLNLFGKDKLEMDFVERFLNGMFKKFQKWLDKVHRKSVVKKNPYARFFFKMLYHQMKDVVEVMAGRQGPIIFAFKLLATKFYLMFLGILWVTEKTGNLLVKFVRFLCGNTRRADMKRTLYRFVQFIKSFGKSDKMRDIEAEIERGDFSKLDKATEEFKLVVEKLNTAEQMQETGSKMDTAAEVGALVFFGVGKKRRKRSVDNGDLILPFTPFATNSTETSSFYGQNEIENIRKKRFFGIAVASDITWIDSIVSNKYSLFTDNLKGIHFGKEIFLALKTFVAFFWYTFNIIVFKLVTYPAFKRMKGIKAQNCQWKKTNTAGRNVLNIMTYCGKYFGYALLGLQILVMVAGIIFIMFLVPL